MTRISCPILLTLQEGMELPGSALSPKPSIATEELEDAVAGYAGGDCRNALSCG